MATKTKKSAAKGIMAPVQPDEVLGAIVGNKAVPRPTIVKRIWEYIKENDLQSTKDKRTILCGKDKKLKKLFKAEKVKSTEILKVISSHVEAA